MIKETFKGLTFEEESHKYTINGRPLLYSVSDIVHSYEAPTNFYAISYRKDEQLGLPRGSHKQLWAYNAAEACALGTKAHYYAELRSMAPIPPTTGFEVAAEKFLIDIQKNYLIVQPEMLMYHKEFYFGGMADLLLRDKITGKYIIADYKTNKELFKSFNDQRLLEPFSDIVADNFGKYSIQLSMYQILLEQVPGVEVSQRVIVHLRKDGEYKHYKTDDLTDALKKDLPNKRWEK